MRTIDSPLYLHRIALRRDTVPSFDDHPFSVPAIRALHSLEFTHPVTFFVGENGTGKSTLLEALAIAWGFNPEGGTVSFNFETRPSHSILSEHLRITRGIARPKDGFFLRAESFYNVASEVDRLGAQPAYGGASLHEQSHGESFLALLQSRLVGHGLYIFDEPEAALSPTRQLTALARIHQLVRMNSQFIIATHSPVIMAYPEATIFSIEEAGLREVRYEDSEQYQVARQFLEHRESMLRELLSEDESDA